MSSTHPAPPIRRSRAPLAAAVFVVCAAAAHADITINPPTNHVASANMTRFTAPWTGTVTLEPDPVVRLAPPAANSAFMNTFVADVAQYPGWTAVTGAGFNGTVQLNTYSAEDRPDLAARAGGAMMDATYTPAVGENVANIRWVQMFNSSLAGQHIDPFPRTYNYPMYFTEAEHATFGMNFNDRPSLANIPDMAPFSYTIRFEVYLTLANFTTKVLTVEDGWRWGYNIAVVPTPGAMGLALMAGIFAMSRRRRS